MIVLCGQYWCVFLVQLGLGGRRQSRSWTSTAVSWTKHSYASLLNTIIFIAIQRNLFIKLEMNNLYSKLFAAEFVKHTLICYSVKEEFMSVHCNKLFFFHSPLFVHHFYSTSFAFYGILWAWLSINHDLFHEHTVHSNIMDDLCLLTYACE